MKQRIAIVGSGISGLTCAWLLREKYHVDLYESGDYFGGHTQTTDVEIDGTTYPVNTGFIVFNDWTYPGFIRLMEKLGVAHEPSDMSFSVRCERTGNEYNGANLDTLFARRRNLLSPSFLRMVKDILRFNRETRAELDSGTVDKAETLGQYLKRKNYSKTFRDLYIVPMGAAIWSASEDMMMSFPLYFFLRFFNNHGMLSVDERPQWRVISGGSQSYVRRMLEDIPEEQRFLNTPVISVTRTGGKVQLTSKRGEQEYDQIIFACHSDQALAMLTDATTTEQDVLGAIPYKMNEVVLHTDSSILPEREKVWASWNYHIGQKTQDTVAVTYYMNRLQNFHKAPVEFCVTLNKTQDIDPDKIIRTFNYSHPVFTLEGVTAQNRHHEISGRLNTHFCGAYWFNGFHEDGVRSALRVTEALGVNLDSDHLTVMSDGSLSHSGDAA